MTLPPFSQISTYWYLMFTTYNGMPIPQIEEGILRAVWKKESEIPELLENIYENIKILINNFHEK